MNDKMKFCAIFLAGVITGSLMTKRKYVKKKPSYEGPQSADEVTIDGSHIQSGKISADLDKNGVTFEEYDKMQNKPKINYSEMYSGGRKKEEEPEETPKTERPYIISPDSFGEFEEYETLGLTYYSNHVLADEDDRRIENADELVGEDSLKELEENELEAIYVRNEKLQCDYEILLDERKYSDVLRKKPYLAEEE